MIRQQMPPLRVKGREGPLHLHLDFDAQQIDALLVRLCTLRTELARSTAATAAAPADTSAGASETRPPSSEDEP